MSLSKETFVSIYQNIIILSKSIKNRITLSNEEFEQLKKEGEEIYETYGDNEEKLVERMYSSKIETLTDDLDYRLFDFDSIRKNPRNVRKEIYNVIFNGSQLGCQLKTFEDLEKYLEYRNNMSKERDDVKEDVNARMVYLFGAGVLDDVGFDVNKI